MKKVFQLNEYLTLIIRLAILLLLFSLCRIAFYSLNNELFDNITLSEFRTLLKGGLSFDISALLYLNSLYILLFLLPFKFKFHKSYRTVLKWIFFITNGVGLAANISDIIYYRFTLKRTTASVFQVFGKEDNLLSLWMHFIVDYWYATLIFVGFMALMVWLYKRFRSTPLPLTPGWKYSVVTLIVMVISGGLSIAGIRGGFLHSTRPINISNAARYVTRPEQVAIVLNTPFSIIRTLKQSSFQPPEFFNPDELEKIYTPVHNPKLKASISGTNSDHYHSRPNIVLIILESFGREHIGALNPDLEENDYDGYTPFLDSLICQSLAFNRAYANGRKSIDALPSIVASVPSLIQPYITSEYANNKVNGLATLLSKIGYETAFYHGAPNGSMGFLAFSKMTGYEQYLGKTEYNNDEDYDGIWGIWDEPFFQFFAKDMNRLKQPFFTTIFSLSSHHPFVVPEKYEGKFPEGPLPLHKCVGYTDMALKHFFETASLTDWYNNTLFIITSDHSTIPVHKQYKTSSESFAIPLLFYKPGDIKPQMDNGLAQQIDILPTIMSFINYPEPFISFGNDLLSTPPKDRFVMNYFCESYQFMYKNFVIFFDGEKTTGIFNLQKDPMQKINLVDKIKPAETEKFMKAYIQQYITRMVKDQLAIHN